MMMLTKFESKSNRVKGIAFHPKRSWILASLHNGCIQLWDYRMGSLLERFDEHDGPVRGIAFHPTMPLFVSGGDDFRIKVWNYKTRRCQFTLNGHLDYIRTTFFHHEHPWIISASDDQTIRIWNWQSRNCIAILTGHNHYVMCAQFHPKDDLIVSASLDQTVRVWDISGLRKKHVVPGSATYMDISQRQSGQADLFGNSDAIVKFVLEGHDRGANWAAFHPTQPLIASGADDRQVKLWRMSESRAWELDTCRGHFNNVSCVLFHPRHDLIISDSEDKTIRVWDMNKRTGVQTFRREHDRFWILAAHPELNLFAAGHDSGLIVFKLERERPAFTVYQNQLIYVKEKVLRMYDFDTDKDTVLTTLKRIAPQYEQPRSLSYNPAEKAVVICSSVDYGSYELLAPYTANGEAHKGLGNTAIFIARNRMAVFEKGVQAITIRDMTNTVTKRVKPPVTINDIFYASAGNLLMSTATSMILYDIQQKQVVAEITTAPVKYVLWAPDMSMVAFLSKHTVIICDKKLEQLCMVHETIRLKSGTWDDSGVFMYSTLNHIKYVLPNGDKGIIRTLDQPIYLTKVKGKSVHCLNRDGKTRIITIDPTEFLFKLALVRKKYDEVLHIIRNSNLVGQSIIAYLQQKGYPEVALHFVKDDKTRFDLAIECGNIDVALETAKNMDREECWNTLAMEGLRQGNHQVVELAYQRTKNFDRLSFLYLVTGDQDKLRKMMKIAEVRNEPMSQFHNALYLGDVEARVKLLKEVGQFPLAYMTAKSHGLEEEAASILAQSGITTEDVANVPTHGQLLRPPTPIYPHQDSSWPLLSVSRGFFAGAFNDNQSNPLAAQPFGFVDNNEGITEIAGEWGADDLDLPGAEGSVNKVPATGVSALPITSAPGEGDEESGWDIDADLQIGFDVDVATPGAGAEDTAEFTPPSSGATEESNWSKQSMLAADHIAAGMFESAMTLLHRQVGAVNFSLLKPHFMRIYQSARSSLSCAPSVPSLQTHLRRNVAETSPTKFLPGVPYSFQIIISTQLQDAYRAFTAGKFQEATIIFKAILHSLLFVIVGSKSEVDEVQQLVGVCREYLVGLALEKTRRETPPSEVKRSLELAAYFSHCQLLPMHAQLAMRSAMAQSYKAKNFASAGVFARRLLELAPPQNLANQARQIQEMGNKNPTDEVKLDYDQYNPFVTCSANYVPIYKGSPSSTCPFCQAAYLPQVSGTLCAICEISEVGAQASGLRVM